MPKPTKNQVSEPVADFRWEAGPAPELRELPDAPVLALLALTDVLLASHADGRVVVYPVAAGAGQLFGAPWELCSLDPPATALAFCGGEVVAASGSRLARVMPDGTVLAPSALDVTIGAMVARNGRVHAVAGDTVSTFERDGDGWSTVHRTPVPLSNCHDIDVDRRGKHVVVCQRPHSGYVVELGTGTVVGRCNMPASQERAVSELYARFSPVTDHVYRAASRAHHVEKLGKLAKSGRSLGYQHELRGQPSAWCTPVATSPDGRHLVSRQSGIGVVVWDLQTDQEVLCAELDDAPTQEKFGKRMRVAPAAVKPMGPNAITVTRWQNVPEQDGEATAVAVAPGARYAATGDRHGVLTVVDTRTRRIEQSDGRVRQPGCLSTVVPVSEAKVSTFTATEWFGVAPDGTVTVVDLATGETRSAVVDVPHDDLQDTVLQVDGDELVLTGRRTACAVDRRNLTPTWRVDDPLPGCGRLSYSDSELLAVEEPADSPALGRSRQIHRYQPRTGGHVVGAAIQFEDAADWVDRLMVSRQAGRFYVHASLRSAPSLHWYPLLPGGELGACLPKGSRMLADAVHAVVTSKSGWAVFGIDDPERPVAVVDDVDPTLGRHHVDLAAGMVATQDVHTRRIYVWNLDGKPVASFDGVGEASVSSFAFADAALWLLTIPGRHHTERLLYRLDMPT